MNLSSTRLIRATALSLFVISSSLLWADPDSQMFWDSNSVEVGGSTFYWSEASEANGIHTDFFQGQPEEYVLFSGPADGSGPVRVTGQGMGGQSSFVAVVDGNTLAPLWTHTFVISISGVPYDYYSGGSNNVSYRSSDGRIVSLVQSDPDPDQDNADPETGVVSGSSTGFWTRSGGFYASTAPVTGWPTINDGNDHYQFHSGTGHNSIVNGQVVFDADSVTLVSGTGKSMVVQPLSDYPGFAQISGDISGYVNGGSLYKNQTFTTGAPGWPTLMAFGDTYHFTNRGLSYSVTSDDTGPVIVPQQYYSFAGNTRGGTATVYLYDNAGNPLEHPSLSQSGYDPSIGTFDGYLGGADGNIWYLSAEPRTAPSAIASSYLWHDDETLSWVSGAVSIDGVATDVYQGVAPIAIQVTVSCSLAPESPGTISVAVSSDGAGYSGTYDPASQSFSFNSDFQLSSIGAITHRTEAAICPTASLWVNGTLYAFTSGITQGDGSLTDTYSNDSVGILTLSRDASLTATDPATLVLSYFGQSFTGTCTNGAFTFAEEFSPVVSVEQPSLTELPPAYWVGGNRYVQDQTDLGFYAALNGSSSPLHASKSGTIVSVVMDDSTTGIPFAGSYDASLSTGVFILARQGVKLPAFPINADGSAMLSSTSAPAEFPPALHGNGSRVWQYLGSAADDTVSGATAAYYADAQAGDPPMGMHNLLKISETDLTVSWTQYGGTTSTVIGSGTYQSATHLFQSHALPLAPAGSSSDLPMPLIGVDPLNSNLPWGLPTPPDGRPATVLIGGQIWRYTGTDSNGLSTYAGYYPGQSLTIDKAMRDGLANVLLNDGLHVPISGIFYNGAFALDQEHPVLSGDIQGTQVAVVGGSKLNTINGDLDITGNLLSLGSMASDPGTAGLTLGFSDKQSTSRLSMTLTGPASEWLWSRGTSASGNETSPMMRVDPYGEFTLFDYSGSPGLNLSPTGVSTFKAVRVQGDAAVDGVLRVNPAGDLDMGVFTSGPRP